MKRETLNTLCTAVLILLFVYNSLDKLIAGRAFHDELINQPLPHFLSRFLVYGIPIGELLIVLALLLPRTEILGYSAAAILLIVFTVYIGIVLLHVFPYIPCSCAGVVRHMSWEQHLLFNLFFITVAVVGLINRRSMGHGEPSAP